MLLEPARIEWRQGHPYATEYADHYFTDHQDDGGIEEVQAFFLRPLRLVEQAKTRSIVTVGELGFGTGLNFAVLAEDFLSGTDATLQFVSFEAHPLSFADWQQCALLRPKLQISQQLGTHPLPLLAGWHHRVYANGRIRLSVFHGDAAAGLAEWNQTASAGIDAWLLDGFAPDRNAGMWRAELLRAMSQAASPTCRVATFTAAGDVRRGLQQAGFLPLKEPRLPYKREALVAQLSPDHQNPRRPSTAPPQVTVVGAGIMGCSMARQMADLGSQVLLYDPSGIAQIRSESGASKVRQAVVHPRLLAEKSATAALRAHAFHHATAALAQHPAFNRTGVLQLQGPNLDGKRLQRIAAAFQIHDAEQHWWLKLVAAGTDSHGFTPQSDTLWFPTAGTLDIPSYCQIQTAHANIECIPEALDKIPPNPTIFCNGAYLRQLPGLDWLELSQIQGQLDHYKVANTNSLPSVPIVGNGYYVPEIEQQQFTLGASYEYTPWNTDEAQQHNLDQNRAWFGDNLPSLRDIAHYTRGTRTVSSDRTPVAGPLSHIPGSQAWAATGLGSMGTVMAPYLAAIISNQLCGWAAPATSEILATLSPYRFQDRQVRRGRRQGALLPPPVL
ncbi:MAG: tRNA (5-methylaminomethyl-2-thiouridine)(34)-methyltransferase MnmD [Pseudomonadota bacterium]